MLVLNEVDIANDNFLCLRFIDLICFGENIVAYKDARNNLLVKLFSFNMWYIRETQKAKKCEKSL